MNSCSQKNGTEQMKSSHRVTPVYFFNIHVKYTVVKTTSILQRAMSGVDKHPMTPIAVAINKQSRGMIVKIKSNCSKD